MKTLRFLRVMVVAVLEIVKDNPGGTYRAVYTVQFKRSLFMFCTCFKKNLKLESKHQNKTLN